MSPISPDAQGPDDPARDAARHDPVDVISLFRIVSHCFNPQFGVGANSAEPITPAAKIAGVAALDPTNKQRRHVRHAS